MDPQRVLGWALSFGTLIPRAGWLLELRNKADFEPRKGRLRAREGLSGVAPFLAQVSLQLCPWEHSLSLKWAETAGRGSRPHPQGLGRAGHTPPINAPAFHPPPGPTLFPPPPAKTCQEVTELWKASSEDSGPLIFGILSGFKPSLRCLEG